jgi:hypothetical protein
MMDLVVFHFIGMALQNPLKEGNDRPRSGTFLQKASRLLIHRWGVDFDLLKTGWKITREDMLFLYCRVDGGVVEVFGFPSPREAVIVAS